VARLQRSTIFIHGSHYRTSDEQGPQSQCGPMKKAGLATCGLSKGLPSDLSRRTDRSDAKGIIVGVHDRQS
jgi:hypothetical protein